MRFVKCKIHSLVCFLLFLRTCRRCFLGFLKLLVERGGAGVLVLSEHGLELRLRGILVSAEAACEGRLFTGIGLEIEELAAAVEFVAVIERGLFHGKVALLAG